jgi:hypothetical protein
LWKEVNLKVVQGQKFFDFTLDYVFRKVISEKPLVCEDIPYLVEVMTVSTTGGGVERTFINALLDPTAQTKQTSINYRQVIARMMSQFIAKAQAAAEWGGKAVWIVQDVLWDYLQRTTGFDRNRFYADPKGNIAVVIQSLSAKDAVGKPAAVYTLHLEQILNGWDRFERSKGESYEGRDFVSVLNAPFTPDRQVILKKTSDSPVAILTCI